MLVKIEKFDINKGTIAKREFELESDTILITKNYMTLAYTSGEAAEMDILCRDKENVEFVSVRLLFESGAITLFTFDKIAYYYDDEFKTLVQENDKF